MSDENEIARADCGTYNEDALVARRLPGGAAEIEIALKDGGRRQWTVVETSTLRVVSKMSGAVPMCGVDTDLELDGKAVTYFEFTFNSGGYHDEDVAKLVVAIAAYTKCTLDIQPMRIDGEDHFASIRCGEESREQLHAIKDEKGAVRVVNPMTAVMRKIAATDTLVVGSDGTATTLDRKRGVARGRPREQIGYFVCAVDDVVRSAEVVAKAAGCAFERQS